MATKKTTKKKYCRKPKTPANDAEKVLDKKATLTEAALHKNDFRKSKRWWRFRTWLKSFQKVDPITGSKLTKGANCHHKDMREENYENLDPKRFVMLNAKSHQVVHFFFAMRDWRAGIKALEKILLEMEKYNSDSPNWSLDDENNSAFLD